MRFPGAALNVLQACRTYKDIFSCVKSKFRKYLQALLFVPIPCFNTLGNNESWKACRGSRQGALDYQGLPDSLLQ